MEALPIGGLHKFFEDFESMLFDVGSFSKSQCLLHPNITRIAGQFTAEATDIFKAVYVRIDDLKQVQANTGPTNSWLAKHPPKIASTAAIIQVIQIASERNKAGIGAKRLREAGDLVEPAEFKIPSHAMHCAIGFEDLFLDNAFEIFDNELMTEDDNTDPKHSILSMSNVRKEKEVLRAWALLKSDRVLFPRRYTTKTPMIGGVTLDTDSIYSAFCCLEDLHLGQLLQSPAHFPSGRNCFFIRYTEGHPPTNKILFYQGLCSLSITKDEWERAHGHASKAPGVTRAKEWKLLGDQIAQGEYTSKFNETYLATMKEMVSLFDKGGVDKMKWDREYKRKTRHASGKPKTHMIFRVGHNIPLLPIDNVRQRLAQGTLSNKGMNVTQAIENDEFQKVCSILHMRCPYRKNMHMHKDDSCHLQKRIYT